MRAGGDARVVTGVVAGDDARHVRAVAELVDRRPLPAGEVELGDDAAAERRVCGHAGVDDRDADAPAGVATETIDAAPHLRRSGRLVGDRHALHRASPERWATAGSSLSATSWPPVTSRTAPPRSDFFRTAPYRVASVRTSSSVPDTMMVVGSPRAAAIRDSRSLESRARCEPASAVVANRAEIANSAAGP